MVACKTICVRKWGSFKLFLRGKLAVSGSVTFSPLKKLSDDDFSGGGGRGCETFGDVPTKKCLEELSCEDFFFEIPSMGKMVYLPT